MDEHFEAVGFRHNKAKPFRRTKKLAASDNSLTEDGGGRSASPDTKGRGRDPPGRIKSATPEVPSNLRCPHTKDTESPGCYSPFPEPGAAVRRISSLSATMASSWRLPYCTMASRCCAIALSC